jgi:hypothetical protein
MYVDFEPSKYCQYCQEQLLISFPDYFFHSFKSKCVDNLTVDLLTFQAVSSTVSLENLALEKYSENVHSTARDKGNIRGGSTQKLVENL